MTTDVVTFIVFQIFAGTRASQPVGVTQIPLYGPAQKEGIQATIRLRAQSKKCQYGEHHGQLCEDAGLARLDDHIACGTNGLSR